MQVEDFNYLWTSPLIPQDPFVYRSTLCPELKKQIQDTFLSLDQHPDGKKYLAKNCTTASPCGASPSGAFLDVASLF